MYTGLMLFTALFLVVLNGMFVAAEFSFVKARKTRLELRAKAGSSAAQLALFGVAHLDAYLSVCQLGITLSSLGLGWLGEPAVAALLRPVFQILGITSPTLIASLSVAIGFTLITFLHVVFGELVPKSISIQRAEATALVLALPMRVCYVLWYPVVVVMNGISSFFLHLTGFSAASESEESHSPEELRMLILDSSRQGQLDESEGRMLGNIFSFYSKMAKDIMIHRMDVAALAVADGIGAAKKLVLKSGYTRFPVYDGNRDNIIGFIHAKDLLHKDNDTDLRSIMREPLYTYETAHLDRVLEQMQEKRRQFCVVVDEYGLWQGIFTMEDLMEAIVGDIQDEFDNEAPDCLPQPDGSVLVRSDLSLEELGAHIDLQCTDMDAHDYYKILAAHIVDELGRIPSAGDAITMCGKKFTVTRMDRNRIRQLRVEDAFENAPNNDPASPAGDSA